MLKDLEDEQPKSKSESDKIYQRHLETFQITDDKEVQAELTSAYVKWVEDKKAAKAKKDEDIL